MRWWGVSLAVARDPARSAALSQQKQPATNAQRPSRSWQHAQALSASVLPCERPICARRQLGVPTDRRRGCGSFVGCWVPAACTAAATAAGASTSPKLHKNLGGRRFFFFNTLRTYPPIYLSPHPLSPEVTIPLILILLLQTTILRIRCTSLPQRPNTPIDPSRRAEVTPSTPKVQKSVRGGELVSLLLSPEQPIARYTFCISSSSSMLRSSPSLKI